MRASKEDTLDANLFYYEKGNSMDAFDYVMESLSKSENEYFNSKDKNAKKIIEEYKKLTKNIIVKTKKADAYIKATPGCDQFSVDGKTYNPKYREAWNYVNDAYNDLDSLIIKIMELKKYPEYNGFEYGGIIGLVSVIIVLVILPFINIFLSLIGGAGLLIYFKWLDKEDMKKLNNESYWREKEKEWKDTNKGNSISKLNDVESSLKKLEKGFKKKYSPWVD